jgi:hypothetical protein
MMLRPMRPKPLIPTFTAIVALPRKCPWVARFPCGYDVPLEPRTGKLRL